MNLYKTITRYPRPVIAIFILHLFLFTNNSVRAEKMIWNKESGWVDVQKLTKDTLDQRYRRALALITDQQYIYGIKELKEIIKDAPDSEFTEPAMFNIAHAFSLASDYKKAFNTYEEFLNNNPGSRRTEEVIEKQYNLAITQMEGLETRAAIRMFEKIIEHNPLGSYAADSQVKIADCNRKLKKFDVAIENYETLIEEFSDSAWVPYAQYQIPICKVEDERRQDRNYGLLTEAEDGFEDYMANNPTGTLVDDVKKKMDEIMTAKAEREYEIGEFYLRRKKPKAAKVYFEMVEKEFSGTVWAIKASQKLQFLEDIGAIRK